MAKIGNATFVGKSGKKYRATVFPWKTTLFKEDLAAVYFVTRRFEQEDGTFAHEWLYVDQTSDMRGKFKWHPMTNGFEKYKANAVCVIREDDADVRKMIHTDLWYQYLPLLNEA